MNRSSWRALMPAGNTQLSVYACRPRHKVGSTRGVRVTDLSEDTHYPFGMEPSQDVVRMSIKGRISCYLQAGFCRGSKGAGCTCVVRRLVQHEGWYKSCGARGRAEVASREWRHSHYEKRPTPLAAPLKRSETRAWPRRVGPGSSGAACPGGDHD